MTPQALRHASWRSLSDRFARSRRLRKRHIPAASLPMIGRPKFVLASGSPRRLALLNQAGIEPDRAPARRDRRDAEEGRAAARAAPTGWPAPRPRRRSTASRLDEELRGSYILAADTVVAVGRRILPKAELLDEAAQCLRLLSGRNHRVYTGDLPRDAEGGLPPAPDRDAGALQAALERGHRGLPRLRRVARQGGRLRGRRGSPARSW